SGFEGVELHLTADGILIAEKLPRESLIDDGHLASVIHLACRKDAATQELNPDGGKVSFAAQLKDGFPFFRMSFAGDFDFTSDTPIWRERGCFRSRDDAGRGVKPLE